MNIDLAIVARDLKLPPEKLAQTVALLDDGNTIPFITRFRKDETGGLNENQIQAVKQKVAQLRALAERKTFVLKSIESQGQLTDELKTQIEKTGSSRTLEDLYRPFKSRKQTRSATARQQGLEPLAEDILSGASASEDLSELAARFVRVDKGLNSVDDVFKGVTDLLVEKFAENRDLRSELRRIVWATGQVCTQVIAAPEAGSSDSTKTTSGDESSDKAEASKGGDDSQAASSEAPKDEAVEVASAQASDKDADSGDAAEAVSDGEVVADAVEGASKSSDDKATPAKNADSPEAAKQAETSSESPAESSVESNETQPTTDGASEKPGDVEEVSKLFAAASDATAAAAKISGVDSPVKKKKKKKKKKKVDDPFKDYQDFRQSLKQFPHYRILAINRGERSGRLKVRVEADSEQLNTAAIKILVPENHAFAEFLGRCATEAVSRVLIPSLEREVRRELTETAETHAVDVFANNLRSLLLQPTIRDCRVLAIDPGFKRGCSVAVLDAGGGLIDSGHVFVVGNKTRIDESGQKIVQWLQQHQVDVIAIGNGTACRHVEQMVSDVLSQNLEGKSDVRYVIVNEAGASIYSTSEIGREELPDVSPSIRSAVSIGRRLQDPLSELVKITPANIGVGMYQHDVKARHLTDSLDDVVQFCVNRVGVNVNSASPALLKYVSGLNALTAQRIYEHRKQHGPFKSRQQLREVNGFGDATFLQAAGFLRIHEGDVALDVTAIHPESYPVAEQLMQKASVTADQLFPVAVEAKPEALDATTTAEVDPPAEGSDDSATVEANASLQADPDTKAETTEVSSEPETANTSSEAVVEQTEAPAEQPERAAKADEAAAVSEDVDSSQEADATSSDQPVAADSSAESSTPEDAESKPEQATVTKPVERLAPPSISPEAAATRRDAVARLNQLEVSSLATEFSTGELLVKDIVLALKKPDWDPRDRLSRPAFRSGIIKADDLKPEMQLDAQVVNVVDFGVFVDIGLGESCLVHVSQLSHNFVRDPHDHYSIGQVLRVWVSEVDSDRRRVKLTAIRPGSKKPSRGGGRPRGKSGSSDAQGSKREHGRRDDRKRGGGKRDDNRGSRSRLQKFSSTRRKAPPKPVKPITDKMLKGKEPMRSFSDLAQFVTKKPETDEKSDKKDDN